jgi:hypothetical protein
MSQMYEYRAGGRWALTNKVAALAAIGVPLEPEPAEWAAWATLGWFPLDTTGYRHVRFVGPGTRFHIGGGGTLRGARFDVLRGWVSPGGLAERDAPELARTAVLSHVRSVVPLGERLEAGLTGGWDSRAVVATLRAAGAPFDATVVAAGLRAAGAEVLAAGPSRVRFRDNYGITVEAIAS